MASFLTGMRTAYPNAKVVAMCGPMERGSSWCSTLQSIVQGIASPAFRYVNAMPAAALGGCSKYPSTANVDEIVAKVAPTIRTFAGWVEASPSVAPSPSAGECASQRVPVDDVTCPHPTPACSCLVCH
jgi:hypothetical protein